MDDKGYIHEIENHEHLEQLERAIGRLTELSDQEAKALRPVNRKHRRAELRKMRAKTKAQKKARRAQRQ